MPIGQAVQQIGPIDPSSLIGRADRTLVEPKATAALIDSFRQGVITADDIVNRIGELGQSKKKAEIDVAGSQSMLAQEAMSPEAQAAREAQMQATTATAQQATERARFPATAAFDQLAPGAGVEVPLLPDGVTPDSRKKEKLGARLSAWASLRDAARADVKNLKSDLDPQTGRTRVLLDGKPLTNAEHEALLKQGAMTFQNFETVFPSVGSFVSSPGTVIVTPRQAPVSEARPSVSVGAPDTGEEGFQLRTPIPGGTKAPTDAQQRAQLALSRFSQSGDMLGALKEQGYDPTSIGSWMSGMLPQLLKTGDRKQYEAAVDAWAQGLLRLESGAAISAQEKTWYDRAFFPQVRDPETVVLAKESMRHDIERMVAEIAQQGGVVSPESVDQTRRIYERAKEFATSPDSAAAAKNYPTVKSAGEVATLPANVEFFLTPDGRTKKNPNFRP